MNRYSEILKIINKPLRSISVWVSEFIVFDFSYLNKTVFIIVEDNFIAKRNNLFNDSNLLLDLRSTSFLGILFKKKTNQKKDFRARLQSFSFGGCFLTAIIEFTEYENRYGRKAQMNSNFYRWRINYEY